MNDHNQDKDYLKDLAPRLFSKEMDDDRQVPDGYFDSLEDKVMARIKDDGKVEPKGKVRSLINTRNIAIAAGFALLLALLPLLRNVNQSTNMVASSDSEVEMDAISAETAVLYLAEEYDIESLASELEFEYEETSEVEVDEVTDEEILDYLLDSELSESLIYESL